MRGAGGVGFGFVAGKDPTKWVLQNMEISGNRKKTIGECFSERNLIKNEQDWQKTIQSNPTWPTSRNQYFHNICKYFVSIG